MRFRNKVIFALMVFISVPVQAKKIGSGILPNPIGSVPPKFMATTDEGIQVGCVQAGHGHDCRFQRGANSFLAQNTAWPRTCWLNPEGRIDRCDVHEILPVSFLLNTESVPSGLVRCESLPMFMKDFSQLECVELYNPAGILPSTTRLLDCLGPEKERMTVSRVDQEFHDSSLWNDEFFFTGSYILAYFDAFSRTTATSGFQAKQKIENGRVTFGNTYYIGKSEMRLVLQENRNQLVPGQEVPALLTAGSETVNMRCQIKNKLNVE